ncbi:MAG: S-methyl-5'-thioinosine phosphorylase [Bacillota bacterium]|jgi:5'-methylthioadenosine phosphorylase
MTIGLISGTGLYEFDLLKQAENKMIATPYGEAVLYLSEYQGQKLAFLPRHGKEHGVLPHQINYRANIYALASVGCKEILSLCCVGSMSEKMPPGSLVLLEQFIDQTWGREMTFSTEGAVDHVDVTDPYCAYLNEHLQAAAKAVKIPILSGGVYLCAQGPRFETAAEIKAYAMWGANLVGMTGVPEAQLAKEAGLCYASLAVVANYAAGFASEEAIDAQEISQIVSKQREVLQKLLITMLSPELKSVKTCNCDKAKIANCRQWGF